jgi:hypothetical protein
MLDRTLPGGIPFGDDETLAGLARALAHPARVRIVRFLLSRPGCIGGDLVEDVGLAQSTVSEHLRILQASGLVVGRIDYPRICHALAPTALAPLRSLAAAIEARTETGTADMCHTPEGGMHPTGGCGGEDTRDVAPSRPAHRLPATSLEQNK